MDTFLGICEWCADTMGLTITILLILIFFPVILAFGMLFIIVAVPIGIISEIFGLRKR